jgi:hypothetical protein
MYHTHHSISNSPTASAANFLYDATPGHHHQDKVSGGPHPITTSTTSPATYETFNPKPQTPNLINSRNLILYTFFHESTLNPEPHKSPYPKLINMSASNAKRFFPKNMALALCCILDFKQVFQFISFHNLKKFRI